MGPKRSTVQNASKKNEKCPDDTVSTPDLTEEEPRSQLEKDVEAGSPIQHVASSAGPANQNHNPRRKARRVWKEIPLISQSTSNSNYVASCTADAAGLGSVDLRRRGRGFRTLPQNSQSHRWRQRKSWNRDLNSTKIPQSKAGESGEAQMSQENNDVTSCEENNLPMVPTNPPVEPPPVATDQQSGSELPQNRNTPSVNSTGATSSASAPSGGSELVKLDELAEKIKENPDKVRAHKSFKDHERVRNAIAPYVFPTPTDDEENNTPCNRFVYIGDELYYRILNRNYKRFLRFPDRAAFISHHVRYYFSKENLAKDKHMRNVLCANAGVCPFEFLLGFHRLEMVNTGVSDLVECAQSIENVELVAHSSSTPTGYRLTIPLPEPTANDNVGTANVIAGIPLYPYFSTFILPSQLPLIENSLVNLAFVPSRVPQNFFHFTPVMTPILPPHYPSTPHYPPYFNGAFYMPNGFPFS